MTSRRAAIWIAALMAVAAVVTASAQPRDAAAEATAIYGRVMSPYCPGLLLADCPSPAAFELRADILRRLEAGESASDIEQGLYRQFGDAIRAVPPPTGSGLWLRMAPLIALAVSFAALLWFVARRRREEQPPPAAIDREMEARLQSELERMS